MGSDPRQGLSCATASSRAGAGGLRGRRSRARSRRRLVRPLSCRRSRRPRRRAHKARRVRRCCRGARRRWRDATSVPGTYLARTWYGWHRDVSASAELGLEPRELVVDRLGVQRVSGVVPTDALRLTRGPVERDQRAAGHDLVAPTVLEEEVRRGGGADVPARIDRTDQSRDLAAVLRRDSGGRADARATGHEVVRPDSMLDAGEDPAENRAVAEADVAERAVANLGQRAKHVDGPSHVDDVVRVGVAELPHTLDAGLRLHARRGERERDEAAVGERNGERQQLGAVASGTVHIDDGGERPLPATGRRQDEQRLHAAAARTRVGEVAHAHRRAGVDDATEAYSERCRAVVGEQSLPLQRGRRARCALSGAAASAPVAAKVQKRTVRSCGRFAVRSANARKSGKSTTRKRGSPCSGNTSIGVASTIASIAAEYPPYTGPSRRHAYHVSHSAPRSSRKWSTFHVAYWSRTGYPCGLPSCSGR